MRQIDWRLIAEITLGVVDQHTYAWSMMWSRLPKAAQYHMERGDRILVSLRSDLESEMFRTGGPRDINLFYPGSSRSPGKTYPQIYSRGPKFPAMNEEEWRELADELAKCLARSRLLINVLSGNVRAPTLDRAINYNRSILRAKMQLEPIAQKQIGSWAILYRDGGGLQEAIL